MLSYVRFEDKTVSYRTPGFLSCVLIVTSTSQDRVQDGIWKHGGADFFKNETGWLAARVKSTLRERTCALTHTFLFLFV